MHVASLHCYPIKGCRGHAVLSVSIDELGVVGDRRLMLVDERGRFLSQREAPSLATIATAIDGASLTVSVGDAVLRHDVSPAGAQRSVVVWGEQMLAVDQGDAAAAWFSEVIEQSCRLVFFGPTSTRRIDPEFSPRDDAQTAFTDGYPLLGVVQESLDELNTRLDEPIPMARFRPNVIVAGAAAWSEDGWGALALGDVTVDAVKPCARCVVTTTDQLTGARHAHQEPLRTLASYRNQRPFGAIFGQNLVPRGPGTIAVDDIVRTA